MRQSMILVSLERIVLKPNTSTTLCDWLKCQVDTAKMRTWSHSVNENKHSVNATIQMRDNSYNLCIQDEDYTH